MPKKQNFNRFKREINESVTDMETGEIKQKPAKVSYFPAKFDPDKGYLFWTQASGSRVFSKVPYPKGMSKADIGNLAILSKHLWGKTNILGCRTRKGARPYTVKEIGMLLDMNEEQAARYLKRAQGFGVIKPISVPFGDLVEVQYCINPLYYFAGNRLSPYLYMHFRHELDEHLPDWVKQEFADTIANKEIAQTR